MSAPALVSVAVPVPALDVLTYRVPPDMAHPATGARVVVPLGRRRVTGIVVGTAPEPDAAMAIRDVLRIVDADAFVPPDVVTLTAWVADYYMAGPGAALAGAVPPHALTPREQAFKHVTKVHLTDAGRAALADAGAARTARQTTALALLAPAGEEGLTRPELAAAGVSAAVVARLVALGLVASRQARVERDPFVTTSVARGAGGGGADRTLTEEQEAAVGRLTTLADGGGFAAALVHGVTGSGKTEVYLRVAEHVRRTGRGVLLLVPEIALTPAMTALVRARFGERVAIQHSGLSSGERHDQWHRIRRGDVDVVVGTRSAVFTPLARLGLLIVDEEHDTSYKQDETPRYHGRDVAVMRAKLAGALVVLGSATPSLESYRNAETGRYALVTLERRVQDRPLAAVTVVNMREELATAGPEVVIGTALQEALGVRLARREQSLVLLNRRGWAVAVFCRQCSDAIECPHCSVSLAVHRARQGWRARCHYCDYTQAIPAVCPTCAAPYLERLGYGTERVEAEVRRLFPAARVGRIDRDAIRRRGSLDDMLGRFASGELDVLVGTQMIAKGHDFPRVTLVGVISADVGLGLADFRASERTFQLLTQVAGRAGRGETAGEAIVQTLVPNHYSIRLASAQDYHAFYAQEIAFRRAMHYPPLLGMVNVIVKGAGHDAAMQAAARLANRALEIDGRAFELLGPAPAPLTRIKGEHRAQFFMKGTARARMRAALRGALRAMPDLARRTTVDVDPLAIL